MTKEDRALELVSETLLTNKKYPWKTAVYLSSRLHDDKDFHITSEALDEILIAHTRSHGRKIRHSFYPSRATLDILWGHVDNVKDFDSLFDPALEKQAGEFRPCEVPTDAPWLFLSHKFQDIQAVLSIRDDLVTRGYGVWLAEAEIFEGEIITNRVQEGLNQCDQFIVYITRAALGSRWILIASRACISLHYEARYARAYRDRVRCGWDSTFVSLLSSTRSLRSSDQ